MFFNNKRTKEKCSWNLVKRCPKCSMIYKLKEDDLLARERGYRGFISVYFVCNECGNDIIIAEQEIPKKLYLELIRKVSL